MQRKKAVSVTSYFKDSHYSGHKIESFELLLFRNETCARQLSLTPKQMSMWLSNALEDTAFDFFRTQFSMGALFMKIFQVISQQVSSEHRQQQLLSQI